MEEMNMLEKILRKLKDEEKGKFEGEIEEVVRMGRYAMERARPMRVTQWSQAVTEEILERTFRLMGDDNFKDIDI